MTLAQDNNAKLSGTISDINGEPLMAIAIAVTGTTQGEITNENGFYQLNLKPGNYTLQISGLGFKNQTREVFLKSNDAIILNIQLAEESQKVDEVTITSSSKATMIEQKGFSVLAIETKTLQAQSIELNQVMDRSSGIRVRQSGGMGSDVNYSLDGMTGKSIRFLIDGIPVDFYGTAYSISNFPMALVDRIDVFKGSVPVELGADALGGAINIVTKNNAGNFASFSYSIGSFNTHRIALQGQWVEPKSGFTARLSTFYNYSDNSYKVWEVENSNKNSVYYADSSTGYKPVSYTKDNPAVRFNDDIEVISGKIDIGITNRKWTDQFFVSLAASTLDRGVQTGATMAHVYGKVRSEKEFLMSSISYQKKNLFIKGLNTNIWAGYSNMEGKFIDTSHVQYGWSGQPTGYRELGGEYYYNRALITRTSNTFITRFCESYQINEALKFVINYITTRTEQQGNDIYASTNTLQYTSPQNVTSRFAGAALENKTLNNRLNSSFYIKYYSFRALVNDLYTDAGSYYITPIHNENNYWGGGIASSFNVLPTTFLKFSIEKAVRLPTVEEALGNGADSENNPYLKPEESLNINLGAILGRYELGVGHGLKFTFSTFYRDVKNKIGQEETSMETRQYVNLDSVRGKGIEVQIEYDFQHKLQITGNATYQDMRNNNEYDETGSKNIIFKDRLKNEPYFMANGGIRYQFDNVFQEQSKLFLYFSSGYVHEFYLEWPSLGTASTKATIPSQLVFDAGISYKFPSDKYSVAFDCTNILNEQIFDNYLLQKPGRAFYLKLAYQIK